MADCMLALMANEDDQTWLPNGGESPEMARRRRLRPRMELGFVRRHRVGLAGALAVAIAIIVGRGVGLVRARIARGRAEGVEAAARTNRANQVADAAKRDRDEALREARRDKAVKDFVSGMLAEADPVRSKGGIDKRRVIE